MERAHTEAAAGARTAVIAAALAAAIAAGACARPAEAPPPPPPPTPAWVEAALIGEERPCTQDDDCASGLCRFDACIGALAADQYWLQELAGRRIGARVASTPGAALLVVAAVRAALEREGASPIVRARAAFVVSFVPGPETTALLVEWLADPADRVRRQAALALVARGEERGRERATLELHAPDVPRRAEAARALGGLPGERTTDALVGVLEDEDRHVRSEALLSLARLRDPRAVRPLVRALEELPGPERHAVWHVLRTITGRRLGLEPAEWQPVLQ
jgi:HEAT repeat protein